jgi:hypothetical protein
VLFWGPIEMGPIPIGQEVYGIPRDRVIGSAIALEYVSDDRGGTIMRKAEGSLRLLLLHDDNEREFDYTSGAEQALEVAGKNGWTIVSMKNDWATVF